MSIVVGFALAGIILVLGFIGNYLFRKTSVPDILVLIFLGMLIGPAFRIVEPSVLAPISELFASLALLIILFDGGLNLNLKKVLQDSPRASMMAFLGVFVSMALMIYDRAEVDGITHLVLGWDIMLGMLLGAILGGTSSSIVIPLVSRARADSKVSTVLSLESAFTDAIVVVLSLTIMQFLLSPATTGIDSAAVSIAGAFSIAIVFGIATGLVWLKMLKILKKEMYDDILTLAIVLLFYSVTEALGGNGAIFALVFGLVLGNGRRISKFFWIKDGIEAGNVMKKFESQMSFFVRTFFFVYLGLIFAVGDYTTIAYSLALTALLFAGTIKNKILEDNKFLMSVVMPRGLAAAVLAQIVINNSVPGTGAFQDMIILVIIFSVIISTVGVSVLERNNPKEKKKAA